MGRPIKKGTLNVSTVIRIVDSTDGTPEQAVEHNTSGIDLWYRREGAVRVAITEAALTALDDAHSDGGIEHIDDGYYRLDLPDLAFATGSNGVMIGGAVTSMIVMGNYHTLVDYDPYDTVRLGLTALPNAAADGAFGLPISDAGGLDMDATDSAVAAIPTTAMRGTDIGNLNDVSTADLAAALVAIDLDHLTKTAASMPTITPGTYFDQMFDDGSATYDRSTDSLQALRDNQSGATASAIADQVWQEAQVDHTDVGTFGIIATEIAAIPTTAMRGTDIGNLNDVSTADLAAALVAIGLDHWTFTATAIPAVTPGTFLDQLLDDGSATYDRTTDSLQAVRDHATTIKSETASILDDTDLIDNGTSGLAKIASDVAAILIDTSTTLNNLIDSEIADILTDTAEIGVAGIGLSNIPWNASWDAEVQSEVEDALTAHVVETNNSITLPQAMRVILAAVAGVTSSGGDVLKDPSGTSTRITATIDGSQNRTAMTLGL